MDRIVYRPHFVGLEFIPIGYKYNEKNDKYRHLGVEFDTKDECQKYCDKFNSSMKPITDKYRN